LLTLLTKATIKNVNEIFIKNQVNEKQKQREIKNQKSMSISGYIEMLSMRLCLNKNIATKKKSIWHKIVKTLVRKPMCNSLKSLIILMSLFFIIGANVTIIAAVADLKAQMFHFKTKVYEKHKC